MFKKLPVLCLSSVLFLLFVFLLFAQPVRAVCPVCTIAVGAGLGLSRYFGIDDAISGIWVGGLLLSSSFWLVNWLEKKHWHIKYLPVWTIILMYLLVLGPLWISGIIGHPSNQLLGIDKLLIGTAIGSLAFAVGITIDKQLRQSFGHQFFYYQKVVFPVGALTITSLILYLIPK